MKSLCGFNFLCDGDSLNHGIIKTSNIIEITIKNGIYNHMYITKDIDEITTNEIPEFDWGINFLFNCDFDENISAGSIDFNTDNVDTIRLKRRTISNQSNSSNTEMFKWLLLKEQTVTDDPLTLSISYYDRLTQAGVIYEYAYVPVLSGVEGNYISKTIESKFNSTIICNANKTFVVVGAPGIGSITRNKPSNKYVPLGSKYPTIYYNGDTDYSSSTLEGIVIDTDTRANGTFDRFKMKEYRDVMIDFLNDGQPKLLKDANGNYWLVTFDGEVSTTFSDAGNNVLGSISGNWNEVGSPYSQEELYNAGILDSRTNMG